MAIYMKFGKIDGNVTAAGFEKWIELNSFQFGVGRGISSPVGSTEDREGSPPSVSEITVTKVADKASNALFKDAVAGDMKTAVKISIVTTDNKTVTEFLRYELTNTAISGYSVSSGGDRPSESLSLNFTKVEISFQPKDSSGAGTGKDSVGYDLTTASTI